MACATRSPSGCAIRGVHEVGRLMLPRVVGLAAVQINFLVNTILASGLAAGSLSALNYAWLLMLLPQGVFAQAVATAAFPTFSTQAARGQRDAMRSTLTATLRAVLYLSIPAAVGLIVLRVPLVQLLFERGAFTPLPPRWCPGRWLSLPWDCRPTRWSRSSSAPFMPCTTPRRRCRRHRGHGAQRGAEPGLYRRL